MMALLIMGATIKQRIRRNPLSLLHSLSGIVLKKKKNQKQKRGNDEGSGIKSTDDNNEKLDGF